MAALLRSRLKAFPGPRLRGMSLFWRVFTANAALLAAAAVVLGGSPVTVSWPIAVTEAVVLGLGLTGMLAANTVLLRLAFAPLTALLLVDTQAQLQWRENKHTPTIASPLHRRHRGRRVFRPAASTHPTTRAPG
jgi:hypothetical protein